LAKSTKVEIQWWLRDCIRTIDTVIYKSRNPVVA